MTASEPVGTAAVVGAGPEPTPRLSGRPWAHRLELAGTVAVPVVVGAGLLLLHLVDPNETGNYPACPFKALTGLDCPGCGTLRGLHALTNGDLARALDHNLLMVLLVPVVVASWALWTVRTWTGRQVHVRVPVAALWGLLAAVLLFWVVRNVPGVPLLGSGVG